MDQAATLRRLMQMRGGGSSDDRKSGQGAHVITVASGKGGVGKSVLVANLGATLARSGLKVLLVDADFGLANLDLILNVQTQVTLEQVCQGKAGIKDSVIGIEPNLWLLPSSSGVMDVPGWNPEARSHLINVLESSPWEMDIILVDCGSGIQDNVLSVHSPLHQSLVVLTPEPTSLTDAYGLIKLLRRERGITKVSVVVNQVTDGRQGQMAYQKLRDVAARFVDVQLQYIGHCVRDEKFSQSVMKRKILLDLDLGAPAIPCLDLLAKHLNSSGISRSFSGRFKDEPTQAASLAVQNYSAESKFRNTAGFWRTLLGEVKA